MRCARGGDLLPGAVDRRADREPLDALAAVADRLLESVEEVDVVVVSGVGVGLRRVPSVGRQQGGNRHLVLGAAIAEGTVGIPRVGSSTGTGISSRFVGPGRSSRGSSVDRLRIWLRAGRCLDASSGPVAAEEFRAT